MKTVFKSKQFAEAIQEYCKIHDMKQQAFADVIGVSRTNVSFYMNGKQMPTMEVFSRICELLASNPADFFTSKEQTPLQFLMGRLSENDQEPLDRAFEKIRILRKYVHILDREGD